MRKHLRSIWQWYSEGLWWGGSLFAKPLLPLKCWDVTRCGVTWNNYRHISDCLCCPTVNWDVLARRTHHGLDDRMVMQWWWILPPRRNGNLHSLPPVVRTWNSAQKHWFSHPQVGKLDLKKLPKRLHIFSDTDPLGLYKALIRGQHVCDTLLRQLIHVITWQQVTELQEHWLPACFRFTLQQLSHFAENISLSVQSASPLPRFPLNLIDKTHNTHLFDSPCKALLSSVLQFQGLKCAEIKAIKLIHLV